MVELNALPEPLCVFCLVGIIFLWEAQCWWFVYFTYFHRCLNNLVRWTWWLYYRRCMYCFIFIFEFTLCVQCALCMQLCGYDHLGMWGEAGGWRKESSLIAHCVLWDRVSHWSWSLLLCLDRLARQPAVLGLSLCTTMPRCYLYVPPCPGVISVYHHAQGLSMCTTMPSFTWILQCELRSSFNPTPNFLFK